MLKRDDKLVCLPSHGENRGSSPLGSANEIKKLISGRRLVSNNCPINVYGQAWTAHRFFRLASVCAQILRPPVARLAKRPCHGHLMGPMTGLDNAHEAAAGTVDPGSASGPRRASNLSQRREWFLRSARQGARAP